VAVADSLFLQVLKLHQAVYESTDGRLGHRLLGVPTLLLRTTGARTGTVRCNALVYARDGEDFVLVASKGGSDRPPGWLFNVRAKPAVEIQVGRKRSAAMAPILEPGMDGYERLWRQVNDENKGRYAGYQAKTTRPIALVIVTPSA
jgi:deazaflavin-dependent oxidoreductase (nitroreductase family)